MITGIEPLGVEKANGRYDVRVWATSGLTGKEHQRDMEIALDDWHAYHDGQLVQVCFPYLSADDREFLITGSTPEEWDELFGED